MINGILGKLNKNITFYENSPLLSTADGPYFINLAKKLVRKTIQSFNEKRFFPENLKVTEINDTQKKPSKFEISLLPFLSVTFQNFLTMIFY